MSAPRKPLTEDEFVKARRRDLAARTVEDRLLRAMLDLDGLAVATKTIINIGVEFVCDYGWTTTIRRSSACVHLQASLQITLYVGRRIQSLQRIRLIRHPTSREVGDNPRDDNFVKLDYWNAPGHVSRDDRRWWVLTDDGRHEARKVRRTTEDEP